MKGEFPQDFIDGLRARINIEDVIAARTEIKKAGAEWTGLCPFHKENTPSFSVTPSNGMYYCFGCGSGGNVFTFVQEHDQIAFPKAIEKLAAEYGVRLPELTDEDEPKANNQAPPKVRSAAEEGAEKIRKIQSAAELEKKEQTPTVSAKMVKAYDYLDEHGAEAYQVCRMDPKSFRQRRRDESKSGGWNWSTKGIVRYPYCLPEIIAKPDATIIIVEGEKAADALREIGMLVTCSSGGAGKWQAEISHWFEGRKVIILPDNDPQQLHPKTLIPLFHEDGRPKHVGQDHADDVARKLTGIAKSIRLLNLPELPLKGDPFDWAQAGGTRDSLIELCKAAAEWSEPEPVTDHLPLDNKDETPEPNQAAEIKVVDLHGAPFKCLGYDEGHYYYLPHRTQQVVGIASGSHLNTAHLLTLAPLEFWETTFPTKTGVDWTCAVNACMRWNEKVGTFDSGKIRGRGAWFDEGRSVLHLGNQLLVDNVNYKLHDFRTNFIYEKKPALESLQISRPLTNDEAVGLYHVTKAMNWHKPIDAVLLSGWCVLAPICGAIRWRPHVWLTGQKGTGKSWVVDNIVAPTIGGSALIVQSASTEAGIRQKLRQDARPVMFDEAEGENQHARQRMQSVLELARQASSDGLAEIAKGTAGGKALTYRVRSMFMLGSINVGLNHASDKSRFTVLNMKRSKHGDAGRKQFEELSALVDATLTKEWCASLRSRTYGLIPIIRENAEVLAKAAAEHIGNQRAGDQLGALLAGAYSLRSDAIMTLEDARKWVESYDWGLDQDEKQDSDEYQLLNELLHAQIRVDTQRGVKTRAISELVGTVNNGDDYDVNQVEAEQSLARYGIRVIEGRLVISESHPEIRKILSDSPWAQGWARILERIKGAEKKAGCRFAGVNHRAVSIPIDDGDQSAESEEVPAL
ncbi:MAG: hypothetical protein COA78_06830 [Blastopirellula sp.]|nr:MAG: hypothetical protein COA78_06830 [Blastopirellula sp.]